MEVANNLRVICHRMRSLFCMIGTVVSLIIAATPSSAQNVAKALEQKSAQAYEKLLLDAAQKDQLRAPDDPATVRIRNIEQRLLPQALRLTSSPP